MIAPSGSEYERVSCCCRNTFCMKETKKRGASRGVHASSHTILVANINPHSRLRRTLCYIIIAPVNVLAEQLLYKVQSKTSSTAIYANTIIMLASFSNFEQVAIKALLRHCLISVKIELDCTCKSDSRVQHIRSCLQCPKFN